MPADLAYGLLLFYTIACAIPYKRTTVRHAPYAGWLFAWTLVTGWTVWGYLAALLYALIALADTSTAAPAPSPADR